jgi:hypothetical protein
MSDVAQVTVIDKPLVKWRGKWREGVLALVYKGTAFVQVTDRSVTLMSTGAVFKDGRELAKTQKRYADGWVVDYHVRIHEVVLDFGRRDRHEPAGFFFRAKDRERASWPWYSWPLSITSRQGTARFFTTQGAALRYAIRLRKRDLKRPNEQLGKVRSAIRALQKQLRAAEAKHG